jgi:hypothetical protein
MVDHDGNFTYSRIVAVTTGGPETLFTIYPNPIKDEATLAVTVTHKQSAAYSIVDHTGKTLFSNVVSLNEGLNTITLPVISLPKGIYIVQLKGNSMMRQLQFIKP